MAPEAALPQLEPVPVDGFLLSGATVTWMASHWFPRITSLRPLDPAGQEYLARLHPAPGEEGARR